MAPGVVAFVAVSMIRRMPSAVRGRRAWSTRTGYCIAARAALRRVEEEILRDHIDHAIASGRPRGSAQEDQ
jgi:hypothetical protein